MEQLGWVLVRHRSKSTGLGAKRLRKKTVFFSHQFGETALDYVIGLRRLLKQHGFNVITGQKAEAHISTTILDRLKKCEYFLCLMTRDQMLADGKYTTSPWLLEEKGAALALEKPIVLMIEEGVSEVGRLEGDLQSIRFKPHAFLNASLDAVDRLESYSSQLVRTGRDNGRSR